MAIFPKRWQKVLFALLIITTIVARLPSIMSEGIWYNIGFIFGASASAMIVVVVLAIIADYARKFWEFGKADA
jgi:hypothetical protein